MLGIALIFSIAAIISKRVKIFSAISLIAITLTSSYLLFLILTDDFSFSYVANYSSINLPTAYKISAFWAGQLGSFLLWLLFHSIAGFILTFQNVNQSSIKIHNFLQTLLIILILIKNPFELNEIAIADGVGLNPLLQDFWMAIHPPIIFFGYALLAIPYSLSLGNLLTEPANPNFLKLSRFWTLVAFAFLGAGIFVGGYWAYKVLGWGGYWGWDPVENSSLVPFLICAVLLHLINLAKSKPSVTITVHLAAIFTYSLVIYGTFLTRSGILGDFSVHSFGNSNIGLAIAVVNAIVLIGGLIILMMKLQFLPKGKMYESFNEKSFIILLGSLILIFISVIVWIGMSMPLLTSAMDNPAAVDTNFYVKTTSPLAIVMAILIVITFRKFKIKTIGGNVVHLGVIFGLISIFVSSSGETVSQELIPNVENDLIGHKIIYEGQIFSDDGKEKFYVYKIDGDEVRALTKLKSSGEDAAREPAILKNFFGDIYIAPSAKNIESREIILERKKFFAGDDYGYIFKESEIETDDEGQPELVKVKISITDGEMIEEIEPTIQVTAIGGNSEPVKFFNGSKRLRLTGISGDENKIRVEILPSLETISSMPITATISTKPFIWILWLSAVSIVVGTLISIKR